MQGVITERFINCLNFLKQSKRIPSSRQFAIAIDVHPQCISDIITGKRKINIEIIAKLIKVFDIDPDFIFQGKEPMIKGSNEENTPLVDPVISIVTDRDGEERIVHVPFVAQAGYTEQMHDPVFMQELPTFNLPGDRFKNGTFRCFDIAGDSMEPTLFSGEKLVCSFVEKDNWVNGLRDNYVYVIVTEGSVVVKRIINKIKTDAYLLLRSDNNFYEASELNISEVKEIWQVTYKISPFMPSPTNIRNGLHQEVDSLRDVIAEQSKMIQSLNGTIEKLLKQNRQTTVRY